VGAAQHVRSIGIRSSTSDDDRAWQSADFRRLWFSSSSSLLGSEIGELALPLLAIITLAATPSEVGLLRSLLFLPFLLATLPLGVAVDRWRRRPMMITADCGRFLLLTLIPISIWIGVREIGLVYVIVFVTGCLTVLYSLADFAYLPSLVPKNQIVDANSKLSATQSATSIAGKGVGGFMVDALTAPVAVLADALSYLISAVSLSRIKTSEPAPTPARERSAFREALGGLRYAATHRIVRPLLGEATTFNFFNEILVLGLLVYTARDLEFSPTMIGAVFVAGGVGSFLGSWFGSRFTNRFGYGRVLLTTLILGNTAPVAILLVGSYQNAALAILVSSFWLMGVGIGVANVHAVSLRQTAIPDALLGRVNAGYRLVSWGAVTVGASLGGVLATVVGTYHAMIVGALGIPLATLWVVFSPIPKMTSISEADQYSGAT
jgi:MFS family permease